MPEDNVPHSKKTRAQKRKGARAKTKKRIEESVLRSEGRRVYDLLNTDDLNQFSWLHMLLDPWGDVISRMPLILGNGIWDEALFRYYMFGTMTANSSGVAYANLAQDNWSSALTASQFISTSAVGKPFWYTGSTYAVATSPIYGATEATTGLFGVTIAANTSFGGANPNSETHYNNTAAAIRVRPISASDTTSGTVMVAYTKDTANYPLTGKTYGEVRAYPDDVVTIEERACANWHPDKWLEMPAIPVERRAFESQIPGTAQVSVRIPYVAVFVTGAAASQAFEVEGVLIYQFEEEGSNRVYEHDIVDSGSSRPQVSGSAAYGKNRSVRSFDDMQKVAYHAANLVRPRLLNSKFTSMHPANERTKDAVAVTAKTNPSFLDKIGGLLRKGASFVGSNLDKILLGAAKALPLII